MLKLQTVTPPAVEPITVADVKSQSRITTSADDTLIGTYITAVRRHVEIAILSRALITQTFDLYLDDWPDVDFVEIPRPPLVSITSVDYTDENGSTATIASSNYIVDTVAQPGQVVLKSSANWPAVTLQRVNGLKIRFVAGYGATAADVPQEIKNAMLLAVGTLYENRESIVIAQGVTIADLPGMGFKNLLRNYRVNMV